VAPRDITAKWLTLTAVLALLLVCLTAVSAPLLPLQNPTRQQLSQGLLPPNQGHWFGTDDLGRDVLSRTVWGARLSLIAGTVPVTAALVCGGTLGMLSSYHGGAVEWIVIRLADLLLSVPYFLIALVVVSVMGPGLPHAMLAIGLGLLPSFIRLSHASALVVKGMPYVRTAYASGMATSRILFVHIMPNILSSQLVFATVKMGEAILAAAALSFLGLGAQPPTAEWGLMLSNARDLVLTAPHAVFAPSAALSLTVLAFNLCADEMRDRLDPRYRY
jgi:peptide/nickel transport system permease protein